MALTRRIFLFLAVNILVVIMISLLLNVLNVRPYLQAYGLNYSSLAVFCLVWGMGGALFSLSISRIMAKWLMRVQLIDPNTRDSQLSQLVDLVHRLAKDAKLPTMPQVGVYHSPEVNAFATGPSKRLSLVAVSSGLLNRMSMPEIEAVLAHEVSHVANGDMVTMTLMQGIINAFVMFLARVLAFAFSGLGRGRDQNNSGGSYASFAIMTFLFEILFMLLGSIAIAWFARQREFRADAGGARLAGKNKMISALQALQRVQDIHSHAHQPQAAAAFEAFQISGKGKAGWLRLFATHPPLEERIARLQQGTV
ncbi:MAG: protease HtpX [Simkania sp.]|nr:protease HtpX [Simkania sp.]